MDPITGAVAAAKAVDATSAEAAKVAGNLLTRLLGPLADEFGQHWADALKRRNLARLLSKTDKRSAGRLAGVVNPRLASRVFEDAQFADAPVVSEYLSGVLASSRDETGSDDRGIASSSLIARLSTLQLRLHYLIYTGIRQPFISTLHPESAYVDELEDHWFLLNMGELGAACHVPWDDSDSIDEALAGLQREGLIREYREGSIEQLMDWTGDPRDPGVDPSTDLPRSSRVAVTSFGYGLLVRPSMHGARLLLWGLGYGREPLLAYMSPTFEAEFADPGDAPPAITGIGTWESFWHDPSLTNRARVVRVTGRSRDATSSPHPEAELPLD